MGEEVNYSECVEAQQIAETLLKEREDLDFIDLSKILFIKTTKSNTKYLARTSQVVDMYKFIVNKKYAIEFPAIFFTLSNAEKKMVVHHELLHIPKEGKGLVKHNVEEFLQIIDIYDTSLSKLLMKIAEKKKIEKEMKKINKELVALK